jgi:prepilin-type N-terminal cleavage/methylation domain-containing protein
MARASRGRRRRSTGPPAREPGEPLGPRDLARAAAPITPLLAAPLAPRSTPRGFVRRHGFTLVELLIVVVILAILAAVVIPTFNDASAESKRNRFVDNLRSFITAAQYATEKNGDTIEDASSGTLPTELAGLVPAHSWENGTPMDGVWDSEKASFGFASSIGVHYLTGTNPGDAEWTQVDALVDDGDLTTGAFRKLASDRYYFIIKE